MIPAAHIGNYIGVYSTELTLSVLPLPSSCIACPLSRRPDSTPQPLSINSRISQPLCGSLPVRTRVGGGFRIHPRQAGVSRVYQRNARVLLQLVP